MSRAPMAKTSKPRRAMGDIRVSCPGARPLAAPRIRVSWRSPDYSAPVLVRRPGGWKCRANATSPATGGARMQPTKDRLRSAFDETRERAAIGALRQLLERLRLDLADALARYLVLAPDLFEGVLAGRADAEAQAQHIGLARRQPRQRLIGRLAQLGMGRRLVRGHRRLVGDEIADRGVAILAQGRIEADGIAHEFEHRPHPRHWHAETRRQLCLGRLPAELGEELMLRAHDAPRLVGHVRRDADEMALIDQSARASLADPPRGVGREFVAAPPIE